jgi:CelD/BcsL family acetyltransferase involved in cellulose biosynthesis
MPQVTPVDVGSVSVSTVSADALGPREIDEWSELFRNQADPVNPFLDPIWVLGWYRHFVEASDRELLFFRQKVTGELIGVAPLFYQRLALARLPIARYLRPVGAGGETPLELPGLLTSSIYTRDVTRALIARTLQSQGQHWCETTLSPSQGWFEPEWMFDSRHPVSFSEHRRARACVVLRLEDTWDKTRGRFKRNVKESIRRSQNRTKKDSHAWRVNRVENEAMDVVAINRFLGLHRARSDASQAGVIHPDVYADPRFRHFMRDILPKLSAQGSATIFELERDGVVVAAQLILHGPRCSYLHTSGFDPQIWQFGPVTLLQAAIIQHAIARGDRFVTFSPGPSVSKLRWSEELWVANDFAYGAGNGSLRFRYGLYVTATSLRRHFLAASYSAKNSRRQGESGEAQASESPNALSPSV